MTRITEKDIKFGKHVNYEKNAGRCEICERQTAWKIDGNIVQPCPDCGDKKEIEERDKMRDTLVHRSTFKTQLDQKYRESTFKDFKDKGNNEISSARNQCWWWADNFKLGWWLVLAGNQGTGKTMIKNIVLSTLGMKDVSFINTSAYQMQIEFNDRVRDGGSIRDLRSRYISKDVLCIDEVGRSISSEAFRNYLFEITNEIYNLGKSLIIVSNLLVTGKNDESGIKSISDFIDFERMKEKAKIVPFTWGSFR